MLNILTGRSGSGKTTVILNEIIKRLNNPEDKKNLILFVPEQMSFQAEYEIAKRVTGNTYNRLQVLSFKRLAYRIFLEVGGLNKTFINDMTVNMVITKIIEENKDKFLLYNKLSRNLSFVELVHDVLKEFKSYALTPEVIEMIIQNEQMDETLRKKLHDISLIYKEMIKIYGNSLIDNEDFYLQLKDKLTESNYLKNADIYIDGFNDFTAIELQVILEMLKTCHEVTILFTMDNPTQVDMSQVEHLFNLPYRTLNKIRQFSLDNNIEMKLTHLNETHRFNSSELKFLEASYEYNMPYEEAINDIKIMETENPSAEVHAVARTIFNDVLNNNNTYSDFVIYTNNPETYYPLIENTFKLYNIPVFIDDQKLMLDHFLLNFIDAILEAIKTNFAYEAMFRAIKTEMFIPMVYHEEKLTEKNYSRIIKNYRKRIDILENYCLSHGISGNDWEESYWDIDIYKKLGEKNRQKTKKEEELELIINETKTEITPSLLRFKSSFKSASTIKEQVEAIFYLLQDLAISDKIELYEKLYSTGKITEINLNEAKKHKQVYNSLMELFDELVEVCGEYSISTEEFIKILRTGFKGMKFAIVPPAIDQVMIGSLKRSRYGLIGHFDDPKSLGVEKAFVLGVNENEIPTIQKDTGLMTSKEREYLESLDIELMPTVERAFLEEYYIIYTVLCSPSNTLILSYNLADNDKKQTFPSEIIDKIRVKFPNLKVETVYEFPDSESDNFQYITTKTMTSKLVLNAINLLRKGYSVSELWKALYGYYKNTKELRFKLLGVTYKNEAQKLDPLEIKNIYGDVITTSVSSVERFNHCPYSFFLERGLNIKKRDIQQVESMDIGDLYHETMKEIAHLLIKDNKALHDLPLENITDLVNKIVDDFSLKIARKYFYNNKMNQYLLAKIKQSLISSLRTLHYQSQHSQFKTIAVEEKFGYDAEKLIVKPEILKNGFEIRLKGFIDRIDVSMLNNVPYVRIIDYKSGNREIDFDKIYHRLSLQLLTYLDVVLNNAANLFKTEAMPAGILYYHLMNSEIKADSDLNEEQILNMHHEQYKMKGYTLNDKAVTLLFDDKLNNQAKSDIINVSFKNDGNFKVNSKVLQIEHIDALRKYTKKAIVDSMEEITDGKITIKPVSYSNFKQCQYCDYHSICKFDPQLKENSYKDLSKTKTNIIETIINEIGGEE